MPGRLSVVQSFLRGIAIAILWAPVHVAAAQQRDQTQVAKASDAPILRRPVTLDVHDAPLAKVLREIRRQVNDRITFDDAITATPGEGVTYTALNAPLGSVLRDVLRGRPVEVFVSESGESVVLRPARKAALLGMVTGKVTDAKTGQPIRGAKVTLDGEPNGVVTGDDGMFHLTSIAPGTHTIVIRSLGYSRQTRTVTVSDAQLATVDVTLEASASVLDQVVVTGTVIETERKALPTPITVITADEIQRKGVTRIDQLFRGEVPGIWAQPPQTFDQQGGGGVYVRGSSTVQGNQTTGNSIKTYIDGVEVLDPSIILQLDPSSIEHIELIRGPQAATLYGSNALNGVLQIFTKHGQAGQRPVMDLSLAAGTIDGNWTHLLSNPTSPKGTVAQMEHTIALSGATASTSYRVGGRYHYDGPYQEGASSRIWNGDAGLRFTQDNVTVDASLRVAQANSVAPKSSYQALQGITGNFVFGSAGLYLPGSQITRPMQTLGSTITYQTTPEWRQVLTVGIDRTNYQQTDMPYTTTGAVSDSLYQLFNQNSRRGSITYNSTITHAFTSETNASLTFGGDHWEGLTESFQGQGTSTTGTFAGTPTVTRFTDHNSGFFTQLQAGFSDALFLTAGLRAEVNPNFGSNHKIDYAPRGGVSYVHGVGPLTAKIRASYGRSITPPTSDLKVDQQEFGGLVLLKGNSVLLPEVQLGGDAGLELYYGNRASLQATYYSQSTTDLFSQAFLAPTPPYLAEAEYFNVGKVHNTGIELEGRVNLTALLSLHGAYTIMNSHIVTLGSNYQGTGFWDYNATDQLHGAPHTTGAATLTYARSGTTIEVSAQHTGESLQDDYQTYWNGSYQRINRPAPSTTALAVLPSYTQVDLRLSRTIYSGVTLFGQVNNLTDQTMPGYYLNASPVRRTTLFGVRIR